MRHGLCVLSILAALCLSLSNPVAGQDANATVADQWEEFVHYVLIAKPDLALAHGQVLLDQASKPELLDAVEASRHAETYSGTLRRAQGMETLRDLANKLARKIQDARLERAREPERLRQDIQKLAQGERPRKLALERLRTAGQFAASELLRTLQNDEESKLHSYVLGAMVSLGRDMVYPLSVALEQLEPVQMGQVATVLGEIGYPRSLPYLKRVMENEKVDAHAKSLVAKAFAQIARKQDLPADITAARLFMVLGNNFYTAATHGDRILPGLDQLDNKGVIWYYNPEAGQVSDPLFFRKVPKAIFGDVLAHRAARDAMILQPDLDRALSLWLMSNLRRENRLAGGEDSTYPKNWQPAIFYAYAANPLRAHDVLERALTDGDSDLARDAINALSHNAGTKEMINAKGAIQPMLRSLGYPDRRVRYESAAALTNNRPKAAFPGSYRVVPVLAEAVRQTATRYALVIASDDARKGMSAVLRDLGYEAFGGATLEDATDELRIRPGVDLVVTDFSAENAQNLVNQTVDNYKIAAVPVVVAGSAGTTIKINNIYRDNSRVRGVEYVEDPTKMKAAFEQARLSYAGKEIGDEEAAKYASAALQLLREIALTDNNSVYNVDDAQPALINALKDERQEIVKQAGEVLAILASDKAQQALIVAGLNTELPDETRVKVLTSLAESARQHGTKVSGIQLNNLHSLVTAGSGDVAMAAARAYGALAQPTDKIVDLIRK